MKKFVLLLALCFGVGNVFAQDADKLRDEGDAAIKAKDYKTALAKYSEFLKLTEYKDTVRIYNCAIAANQVKNYEEAAKYFDMAVKYKYNLAGSYTGEAMALRNLKKTDEFLETVNAGLEALPGNDNLEKLLYAYCITNGQAAQKANKFEDAEKLFKAVLVSGDAKHKSNALYCLGSLYYNRGANLLVEVTPLATTDADKYNAGKEKATVDLKKAKEFFEEGNKVRVVVRFRGRQLSHTEVGEEVLQKFITIVQDYSQIEKQPVLEGRNLTVVLSAKKLK